MGREGDKEREGTVTERPRDCVAKRDAETIYAHTTETKIVCVCVTDRQRRDSDEVDWQRQRHVLMAEEEGDQLGGKEVCARTGTERDGVREIMCMQTEGGRERAGGWRWMKREGGERGRGRREGGRRRSMSPSTHTHLRPSGAVQFWVDFGSLNFWKFLSGFLRVSAPCYHPWACSSATNNPEPRLSCSGKPEWKDNSLSSAAGLTLSLEHGSGTLWNRRSGSLRLSVGA